MKWCLENRTASTIISIWHILTTCLWKHLCWLGWAGNVLNHFLWKMLSSGSCWSHLLYANCFRMSFSNFYLIFKNNECFVFFFLGIPRAKSTHKVLTKVLPCSGKLSQFIRTMFPSLFILVVFLDWILLWGFRYIISNNIWSWFPVGCDRSISRTGVLSMSFQSETLHLSCESTRALGFVETAEGINNSETILLGLYVKVPPNGFYSKASAWSRLSPNGV